MKKLLMVFLLLSISLSAQDFRQFKWGDSKSKVKKLEKEGKFVDVSKKQGNEILCYEEVSVASIEWTLIYKFIDQKLVSGRYITSEFTYDVYYEIKSKLIAKYGKEHREDVWVFNGTMISLVTNELYLSIGYSDESRSDEILNDIYKKESQGL